MDHLLALVTLCILVARQMLLIVIMLLDVGIHCIYSMLLYSYNTNAIITCLRTPSSRWSFLSEEQLRTYTKLVLTILIFNATNKGVIDQTFINFRLQRSFHISTIPCRNLKSNINIMYVLFNVVIQLANCQSRETHKTSSCSHADQNT